MRVQYEIGGQHGCVNMIGAGEHISDEQLDEVGEGMDVDATSCEQDAGMISEPDFLLGMIEESLSERRALNRVSLVIASLG